jgi:hypothetical protein
VVLASKIAGPNPNTYMRGRMTSRRQV